MIKDMANKAKLQIRLTRDNYKFNSKDNNRFRMQREEDREVYHPGKELLTCRLCTDIFKKPITLRCGHTFCYNCLYKFMKQNHLSTNTSAKKNNNSNNKSINLNPLQLEFQSSSNHQNSTQNIPLPLCPQCSSLIVKPIKNTKQNTTLANLISHANYKPQIKFENLIYDQEVLNFAPTLLLTIQTPKIQPLPFTHSQIRFKTCFLDDLMEQSHTSFIVIEWPHFKKNIGLAGKIQRAFFEYHSNSHRDRQNHYRAIFTGMFFVHIQKKKTIEINLKSRYYAQATLYTDEQPQLAPLTICKCQQFHSKNIQPLQAFDPFFYFYDKLSNPHYLHQITQLIDTTPLFTRNNSQQMIYACIRILKLKPQQRKQIVESFDDQFRMEKINQFLQKNQHLPVEDIIHITIPGKYSSAFVFGIILVLILLHYLQTN